jgi:hypothetical protein
VLTPLHLLRSAVEKFEEKGIGYCLVGGHAASLYRSQERTTKDVDFAICADPPADSQAQATSLVIALGLTPMIGFIPPGAAEPERRSVCMVTSVPMTGESKGLIDILLPDLPWVSKAVKRAQHNRLDLGFAAVPVITPEDLIIAKCYSLRNSPDRFQDLDDIKEIFINIQDLDRDYLESSLQELDLVIPEQVVGFLAWSKK